ncbi:MAG: DUF1552 domain-containing protein [Myxococcota bacterium]
MRAEIALRRRTFLKALGIGIAAPLAYKMASIADAAPGDGLTRLFIFYIPHGWPIEHVEPVTNGDLSASNVLSPLQPFADRVTVCRGLSMHDGATNHAALQAVVTGFAGGGSVDSIDASIAQALGVTPHAIGAMPYDPIAGFTHDAQMIKHGTWVRPTEDPFAAAEDLFAGLKDAPPPPDAPPPVDDATFRTEALALTESELEQMHAAVSELSTEQSKLMLHLDAVRQLKTQDDGEPPAILSCEQRPTMPALEAMAGLSPTDQANYARIMDAQLQVAAYSMVCGSAQVITMQNMWVNSNLNFGFAGGPGIAKGHHEPISHSSDQAGRAEFAQCQRWFIERLSEVMLTVLDQPDPADTDPERTVLDNSLIYVCSEVSDGWNHNSDASPIWLDGMEVPTYLPAVIIGGGGGYLSPGRVVDVSRHNLDMLATLSDAMGVPVTAIGGQGVNVIEELQG